MGGAVPDGGEGDAGEDEAEAEAEPETGGTEVALEAEVESGGQADEPVRGDVNVEADAGVPCPAKGSGRCDLQAIEELKDGDDEEQRNCRGDDGRGWRKTSGDE